MSSLVFTAAPASAEMAAYELVQAGFRRSKWLAPGIGLAQGTAAWADLQAALANQPPLWIRHLHPAALQVPVENSGRDLLQLETAAQALLLDLDTERSFSIQTRLLGEERWQYSRFDINERLAALVASWGAPLDVRDPFQVVSLTLTPGTAYLGLSPAHENLNAWAGGERRFKRGPELISRAEFKLLEALETFRVDLPASGQALDLGAAPGGWSRLLAEAGLQVTALDPADLDPRLESHPRIRHVRRLAHPDLKGLLDLPGRPFDVLVNDMRLDALQSAEIMLAAADLVRPGGLGIMTLKLPETRPGRQAHLALERLSQGYEVLGARQLFHNRSEVTAALRR